MLHQDQPKKESNHHKLAYNFSSKLKKGKGLAQTVIPKVTDHTLPKNPKCAVKFNFDKEVSFLKTTVLNYEQPKVKKWLSQKVKPRQENGL